MPSISGTRSLNATLLSVCLDPETFDLALQTAEDRHWAVKQASFELYISAKRRPHFADNLKGGDGCVAIVDFDRNPKEAVASATYLQQVFGNRIAVIALASENQPQLMLLAMRAGCTEFLTKLADSAAFNDAFRRIEQQFEIRSSSSSSAGSILAMVGAKGGVGTTTIAVHLAFYLVQIHKKKVLLIDDRTQFGHVCIYLGLDGGAVHFQEVVRNVNRLDSELMRGFVATHSSGLDVLSSPDVGQVARPMHPDDVAAALEFLRTEYDFVVVDCADALDKTTNPVIAAASQVYVVATPEISAIRDLSRYIDNLTQLEDTHKVKAVINRYSSQFAVSLEEIEKAIRLPVTFSIPNTYVELVRSANLGEPLSSDSKSGFSSELMRWASSLTGALPGETAAQAAVPSQKFLDRLKSTVFGSSAPTPTTITAGKRV